MSFGTSFIHETYFNRETFDSLYKVDEAIEEESELYNNDKDKLIAMVVSTEPQKMLSIEDGIHPIDVILSEVKELIQSISNSAVRLSNLRELKSEWDNCHTIVDNKEVAKHPVGEYPHSYLTGDFIETDLKEN